MFDAFCAKEHIRDNKCGATSASAEEILNRLNIPAENWLKITTEFGHTFRSPVGTLQELSSCRGHLDKRRWHFSNGCQYLQAG
jgi:hypothetical protein